MGSSLAAVLRRSLRSHERSPCAAVQSLSAELSLAGTGELHICYRVLGELSRLRIPRSDTHLDPERLWAHTCCELFVTGDQGAAYAEWNFSSTGQRMRFEFDSYRSRRDSSSPLAARSSIEVEVRVLQIEARVPLPPWLGTAGRLGLSAVIEDEAGERSYWALRHPQEREQPDFHHPGGWAVAWTLTPAPALADAVSESP